MTAQQIARLIFSKYPTATVEDWTLSDDGKTGLKMSYWNTAKLGPQPDLDKLTITPEEEAAYAAKEKAKADDSLAGLARRVKALEDLHK